MRKSRLKRIVLEFGCEGCGRRIFGGFNTRRPDRIVDLGRKAELTWPFDCAVFSYVCDRCTRRGFELRDP